MLATAFSAELDISRPTAWLPAAKPKAPDTLADHLADAPVRTVKAKEHIFRDGDAASHVYLVEVGNVCIYKLTTDGRRQVIDFAYPGDLVGLGAMRDHAANAQATTRTRLRCLSITTLHQMARDDARLALKLYEALGRELLAARELLFTVSQRTATERVASFLVALSRRNERKGDDPHEFVLPMTRSDIADFLGLTIETVSRTFTKLRVDGLIEVAQCVLVTIADRAALEAVAGGR